MMKKTYLFLIFLLYSAITMAQVTEKEDALKTQASGTVLGWKKGGTFTFAFSQVSLSRWAAGGQNSLAFNGLINTYASLKRKSSNWGNSLDLGYGLIHQGGKGAPYQKSDDRIELNSIYGQKASKSWYYAALINFKTQFAPGYNYPNDSTIISNFLAPADLIAALGMDFKPSSKFNCFIAPATGKLIIVDNTELANAGDFGVEPAVLDTAGNVITPGKKKKLEFGGYIRASFRIDLMKNINLMTKADFFSNYLKNPQNIVINWENLISMKINKYISATLSTQLIYDDQAKIKLDGNGNTGPRTQFKEIFGVGFSYKI